MTYLTPTFDLSTGAYRLRILLPAIQPHPHPLPRRAGPISTPIIPQHGGVILSESEESEAEGLKNKIKSRPSASDSSLSLRMTPLEMGKKTELIDPALRGREWGWG